MNPKKIAAIPGGGIGKEVIPQGIRGLEAAGSKHGVNFEPRILKFINQEDGRN